MLKQRSSLRSFYGHHHELINGYENTNDTQQDPVTDNYGKVLFVVATTFSLIVTSLNICLSWTKQRVPEVENSRAHDIKPCFLVTLVLPKAKKSFGCWVL